MRMRGTLHDINIGLDIKACHTEKRFYPMYRFRVSSREPSMNQTGNRSLEDGLLWHYGGL